MDANKLMEQAKKVNGKRRSRVITQSDVDYFLKLFAEKQNDPEVKSIRVYPDSAFVPNAYTWRADVTCLVANRDAEGNWAMGAIAVDAHRPRGNGALVTINGRGI